MQQKKKNKQANSQTFRRFPVRRGNCGVRHESTKYLGQRGSHVHRRRTKARIGTTSQAQMPFVDTIRVSSSSWNHPLSATCDRQGFRLYDLYSEGSKVLGPVRVFT